MIANTQKLVVLIYFLGQTHILVLADLAEYVFLLFSLFWDSLYSLLSLDISAQNFGGYQQGAPAIKVMLLKIWYSGKNIWKRNNLLIEEMYAHRR